MHAIDVIAKKRDGAELTQEEIEFFVQGYTKDEIPDYQAAAWLMALYLRGMSDRETLNLTMAMAHSGDMLDLKEIAPFVVDKHSTGGVGDKVSLVVAPLVAACGMPVAKMTGKGLGFTGGTVDKLESIPGYRTDLNEVEFKAQLEKIGIVLTGQSADLAPADGKMYGLRDVTATVESIPLIVSSIMSKKLAAGADAMVLDVKVGSGAFMKTVEQAEVLAEALVHLGDQAGRRVVALISDMSQPLGWAVGNALEVREAINTLHEGGPDDFRDHCLVVAAEMLILGDKAPDTNSALTLALDTLNSGAAWRKFKEMVEAQGGGARYIKDPDFLPQARLVEPVPAPRSGYLAGVDAAEVGMTVMALGGGREKKDDQIDHGVGVIVHYKVGDLVQKETPLFTVHANDEAKLAAARERLLAAHTFSDSPVQRLPLFYRRVADVGLEDETGNGD
ncbi:MAG: thymidine phosphorylase [Anaerolineaceae bacterium 4572_32.2]|nr:MAG: thymidine phosphorylase [Anaerolineaceae bacterium 4572_32.2]HEY73623.1 thymidine phosphorylase [Thermoflexia bacterium]